MRTRAWLTCTLLIVSAACRDGFWESASTDRWQALGSTWTTSGGPWSAVLSSQSLDVRASNGAAEDVISFGRARLFRGTTELAAPSGFSAPVGGVITARAPGFAEEFERGETTLHQQWRFAEPPTGDGPLTLRFPVSGRLSTADHDGLTFSQGRLRVRYGHGTWVDANGTRTEVFARHEAGQVVLEVTAGLLAASSFPAVLDPIISAEFGVGSIGPGPSLSQLDPAVASNGSLSLAVWSGARGDNRDIFAARVGPSGAVLDPVGFVVRSAPGDESQPAVAWNGAVFLVVWEEQSGVFAARVSSAGVVLDAPPILIASAATPRAPAVSSNGTEFLIVWEDRRRGASNVDLYGSLVNAAGVVTTPAGIVISDAPSNQLTPAVTWNGTAWLVVWADARSGATDIYAARLSPAGQLQDPQGVVISAAAGAQLAPAVTWTGTQHLVVWEDLRAGLSDIFAARLSAAGVLLDPAGVPVSTAMGEQQEPGISWTGTEAIVTWRDRRGPVSVYANALGAAATVSWPADVFVGGAANNTQPVATVQGGSGLIYWHDAALRITGATLSASGAVSLVPGAVTRSQSAQAAPALTWDGTQFWLAWAETLDGGQGIYASRVSTDGGVIDPVAIAISTGAGSRVSPSLSWNGTHVVVSWIDGRGANPQIYGARLTPAGALLDPAGIVLSNRPTAKIGLQQASTTAGVTLVAWEDVGTITSDVYAARLSAAGTLLDPSALPISALGGSEIDPAVASDGTNFMVAWSSGVDVRASRVTAAGAVGASFAVAASTRSEILPTMSFDGTNYLVVWSEQNTPTLTTYDLWMKRVTPAGTPDVSAVRLTSQTLNETDARAASGGARSLVVWNSDEAGPQAVVGVWVSPSLVTSTPFTLTSGTISNRAPTATCASGGVCLAAYQRQGANRVRARVVVDGDGPSATAQSVMTNEDTSLPIVLTGTDPQGDPLTFTVDEPPAFGTISGVPPNLTYAPVRNFSGADSLTFMVSDGVSSSAPQRVLISVLPVNDPPTATPLQVTTPQGTPVVISFGATDLEGAVAFTYSVASAPSHGTLSGAGSTRTFTPAPAFVGTDTMTYAASEGGQQSAPATVTIGVLAGAGGGSAGGASGGTAGGSTSGGTAGGGSAGGGSAGGGSAGGSTAGGSTAGGAAGGSTAGGSSAGGSSAGGSSAGGSSAGGSAAGGSTAGGSTAGGAAGGSTAGGSTAGGSAAGGSAAGGSAAGGSAAGGSTAGGSTAGGSAAGGSTAGGSTAGGSTAGGSTAGGSTAGGSTAGGSTAGGSTAGGSTAGGSTAGGSTAGGAGGGSVAGGSPNAAGGSAGAAGGGGATDSPSGCGCGSTHESMWLAAVGFLLLRRRIRASRELLPQAEGVGSRSTNYG